MREASWKDCLEKNSSMRISPDIERAKSLIETSEERISIVGEIDERNANFIFEDYYSSLLEILHALVLLNGYKVTNHICLGYYLRDILKREDLFIIFDDLRYKRNSLTYYGRRMDFGTAMESIEKSKMLIREVKKFVDIALRRKS
ncbi:MAG: hypothetical protein DRP11_01765 [Candidatus Aenigmatarchaeota archaeon]|nr:MAG: hypothetical protein DRP11_01765 [Candidatus Aenigmarchaeota archaeon]